MAHPFQHRHQSPRSFTDTPDLTGRIRLFVGGEGKSSLPEHVQESHLRYHFREFNPVNTCIARHPTRKTSKGHGYVDFASCEDAQRAREKLSGSILEGCMIRVVVYRQRSRSSASDDEILTPTSPQIPTHPPLASIGKSFSSSSFFQPVPQSQAYVYPVKVTHIPSSVTESVLCKEFQKAGDILHCRFFPGATPYALINFGCEQDAYKAVQLFNGHVISGSKINVRQKEPVRNANHRAEETTRDIIEKDMSKVEVTVDNPALIPYFSSSDFAHFKKKLTSSFHVVAKVEGANEVLRSVIVQTHTDKIIRLDICKGNLANEDVDAIVNATNASLKHAGGVAKAILEAGGEIIQRESDEYIKQHDNHLEPGSVVVCLSCGNLSCKLLVHAVGPSWEGGSNGEEKALYTTVMKALNAVQKKGLESVAFPAIGTGIFKVPDDVCVRAPLEALQDFYQSNTKSTISHVRFVIFQKGLADKFAAALNADNLFGSIIEDRLYRVPKTSPMSCEYIWRWQNDKGSFDPFSNELNKMLNDEFKKNPQGILPFQISGRSYCIYFSTMTQMNTRTGVQRKLQKVTSTSTGRRVQWYYQDDTGGFVSYTTQQTHTIESMFQAGNSEPLTINRKTYMFDFSQMHQINVTTSYKRTIKREVVKAPTSQPSTSERIRYVVTLHGARDNLPSAKSELEKKLKSVLKNKSIPFPDALEESIEEIASEYDLSFEMKNADRTAQEHRKGFQKVIHLEGLDHILKEAMSAIQAEIITCHTSAPKPGECEIPNEWQPQSENLKLAPVTRGSHEWNKIERRFKNTLPMVQVRCITRIQNKWLWQRYTQHKQRLDLKNNGQVNEMELFHGTRGNDPKVIYQGEDGFDMRFSSKGMWGQANYFAVNASYSHNYAYSNASGNREMFLVKVLTGDSCSCSSDNSLRLPPEKPKTTNALGCTVSRYDTVNGSTNGSRVYMTYDNDKAYPAYLIEYK